MIGGVAEAGQLRVLGVVRVLIVWYTRQASVNVPSTLVVAMS